MSGVEQGGRSPSPTLLSRLLAVLPAPVLISSTRLLVACVLASLFTLLPSAPPPGSCFGVVFAIFAQTQLHTDNSLGTALRAASLVLGTAWVGTVVGGALSSLALLAAEGVPRTAAQCCLGVLGLAMFAVMRSGPEPATLGFQGILATMFFGLIILLGQFDISHAELWTNTVGGLLLATLVAVASTLAAAVFVLPSLASEQVPGLAVSLIRDMGAAVSSGSRLLTPRATAPASLWGPHSARWDMRSPSNGRAQPVAAGGKGTVHGRQPGEDGKRGGSGGVQGGGEVAEDRAGEGLREPLLPASSLVFEEPLELVHDSNIRLLSTATLPLISVNNKVHGSSSAPLSPKAPKDALAANSPPLSPSGGTAKGCASAAGVGSDADAEDDVDLVLKWYLPAVGSLRQRLTAAKALLPASSAEPAWFHPSCTCTCPCMGGRERRRARLKGGAAAAAAAGGTHPRYRSEEWSRLLDASNVLISRIASLESVLEEGRLTWNSESLMVPAIQQILALTAATTARVSLHLSAWLSGRVGPGGAAGSSSSSSSGHLADAAPAPEEWAAARAALRHAFSREIGSFYRRAREASKANPMVVGPVRAFMTLSFLGSLAASMADSAQELQAATEAILAPHDSPQQQQQQQQAAGKAPSGRAQDLEAGFAPAGEAGTTGAAGTAGAADTAAAAGTAGTAGAAILWLADYLLGWLRPLAELLLFEAPWVHLHTMYGHLRAAVKSKTALQLLTRRYVQAGFKFWLATSAALVAILVISAAVPWIASSMPLFGFVATISGMRERVESTLEKVAARVVGTILGATFGFGIMSSLVLANSPGALIGFLAAACIVLGPLGQGHIRLLVGLTLWTYASTMLCQFKGCCGATEGRLSVYLTRLVSVAGGVLWCSVLNRVLLPWRGAAYEVESMADAVKTTVALLRAGYELQYEAAERAAYGPPDPDVGAGTDHPHQASGAHHHVLESGDVRRGSLSHAGSFLSRFVSWAADGLETLSRVTLGAPAGGDARAREEQRRLLMDPTGVSQAVGTTLVRVQAQMAREGVAWQSGLLAVPQLARAMLAECFRMLDALEGVQLAANTHMELVTSASTDPSGTSLGAELEAAAEPEQQRRHRGEEGTWGQQLGPGGGTRRWEGGGEVGEAGRGGHVVVELGPAAEGQGAGGLGEGGAVGGVGVRGGQHGGAAPHPLSTSTRGGAASPFVHADIASHNHAAPSPKGTPSAPASPCSRHGAAPTRSSPHAAAPASPPRHPPQHATPNDLVFQQFVRPYNGVVQDVLQGLELLAVLVVGHCRWPSEATRRELGKQIDVTMELRTAVYEALVRARVQRLRAVRSGTMLVPPNIHDHGTHGHHEAHGAHGAHEAHGAAASALDGEEGSHWEDQHHMGAEDGQQHHHPHLDVPGLNAMQQEEQHAHGHPGSLGPDGPHQHQPSFSADAVVRQYVALQNSEIAVHYLSLLHAMYKVNNRIMAVARVAMEYGDDVARGRAKE